MTFFCANQMNQHKCLSVKPDSHLHFPLPFVEFAWCKVRNKEGGRVRGRGAPPPAWGGRGSGPLPGMNMHLWVLRAIAPGFWVGGGAQLWGAGSPLLPPGPGRPTGGGGRPLCRAAGGTAAGRSAGGIPGGGDGCRCRGAGQPRLLCVDGLVVVGVAARHCVGTPPELPATSGVVFRSLLLTYGTV